MAKGSKIILEENGVLTQEALLAYAEGRLPAADVAQFEKLLQADPFSQDALEGMKLTADKARMRTAVAGINDRLRERTNFKTHKTKSFQIHWSNYAYAAAVFGVLIGLGVVLVNFLNNRNSQTTQTAQVDQPVEEKIDSVIAAPAAAVVQDSAVKSFTLSGAADTQTALSVIKNQPASPIMADQAKDETKPEPIAQRLSEVSKKKDQATAPAAGSAAAPPAAVMSAPVQEKEQREEKVKMSRAESAADDKQAAPKTDLQEAKELFDAGEFDQALKKYNKVLDEQPGNADALYFGGICNYIKGENKKAEKSFDKLMTTNAYADGAKWYKANLLIRKGKNEQAKTLLRELSNTNGSYKDRAIRKFEEINK